MVKDGVYFFLFVLFVVWGCMIGVMIWVWVECLDKYIFVDFEFVFDLGWCVVIVIDNVMFYCEVEECV